MGRIERDFVRRELLSLALLSGIMAVLLCYLISYARLPLAVFWLLPLLMGISLLRMGRQAKEAFSHCCGVRSEGYRQQVEQEYAAPHPICRVAYVEMHLLKSCIVCRHKRQLVFIPEEEVVHIRGRFRLVGVRRILILQFVMDTGRPVTIDFSVWHPAEGEKARAWLLAAIGEQRLRVEG